MLQFFSLFKKKQSATITNLLVSFGKDGNANQYLKEGWRPAEKNHQWSIGSRGSIQLPLCSLRPTEPTYLVMKLSTFVVPHVHDSQRVSIMINGANISEFHLSSSEFCHKVFPLPPGTLAGKIIDIAFHTPDSKSPADAGISPDNDKLGICLMYLIVVQESFLENVKNQPARYIFRSQDEYQRITAAAMPEIQSRQIFEQVLAFRHHAKTHWNYPGYCPVCEQATLFQVSREDGHVGEINYREQLICGHCRQKNRHRFLLSTALTTVPGLGAAQMQIYAYEQIGSFFEYLGKQLKDAVVVGSEYLGEEYVPGSVNNGIRHENAMHLSFDDESFDALISCDVFEHVPDIAKVFAESCRVLKRGGVLFFTVPFDARAYASVKRAQRNGNEIDFLRSPEYHGNPLDPKGSLVFYDFGWDILDRCKEAGFATVHTVSCWDANSGYLGGDGHYVFVAKKRL